MQPAHSNRVCHRLAILFKPIHLVLHTDHPVQQATCSGPASDNEHFTCYSALWLTGHVHISWSCVNFTALIIIPSHISWKLRLRGSMTCPTSKCQNRVFCRSFHSEAAFVTNGHVLHIPLLMPHYVGEKEESLAGKSSCTALLGGLYGSVSFLTRLISGYPIKVGSWWK